MGYNAHATVLLDPWAQTPTIVDENDPDSRVLTDAIDLDAVGQDKEPW